MPLELCYSDFATMLKGLAIIVIALLVVAFLLAPLTLEETFWDDGLWPLSVTVVSVSGTTINTVSGESFSSGDLARQTLKYLTPPHTPRHSAVADLVAREQLVVPIPTSYKTHKSLWSSSSRYNQMRLLVVIVQYHDGRREGRLVEIPDLRESRSLRVEFP